MEGQIGAEPSPLGFLDALDECMVEWGRVLKPGGSVWVNLNDKYAGAGGTGDNTGLSGKDYDHDATPEKTGVRAYSKGLEIAKRKSLMGLPWRFAIRQMDAGWTLRSEVIWCLSGGVRLYARINGKPRVVMLRDLHRQYKPESVELWNGEKWTQVLGWSKTGRPDNPVELRLRSGEWISSTANHKFPTTRGLLEASDIRIGDVLDTTILPDEDDVAGSIDSDVGWMVGLYLAEGSRTKHSLHFAGHKDEVDRHKRLKSIAERFDGGCGIHEPVGNAVTCALYGPILNGIIARYVVGSNAKNKHLTAHAWRRGNDFLKGVVDGYLEGDGHYDSGNNRWRLGFTRNPYLASDLRTLAARLGASIRLNKATTTGFGEVWKTYKGQWRWNQSEHHNTKSDSEVLGIRKGVARNFYDIGVADDPHLFALASGVLTHNSKPSGMPEAVTDRVRRSHETWFHFTKGPDYFSAMDEIRIPYAKDSESRMGRGFSNSGFQIQEGRNTMTGETTGVTEKVDTHELGRIPGSVWRIPLEALRIPQATKDHYELPGHFAAFPQEWPRRLILAFCPEDGLTLDPFGGTGTVAGVARMLGREAINNDLSPAYNRLAVYRIWESKHFSKTESAGWKDKQGAMFG